MKVAAYVHLQRMRNPTGVGLHIIEMVGGLAATPGIDLTILAPKSELDADGKIPADLPLRRLPLAALPFSRRWLEASWYAVNFPKVDRWCRGADWVYCPAESFVATGKAALAVTVHDTYLFESDWHGFANPQAVRHRKRWIMMFRRIGQHAKLILAVSEFTKSRLVQLFGLDPDRIAVVGNGVEEAYFAPPSPQDQPDAVCQGRPYICAVGALAKKKGADYLIALARALADAAPDMRIVVSGLSERPFEQEADQIGNIIRLGYLETPRQVRLLRGAAALLLLSRYEGFGIPALEAMALGVPAIVSHFGALPEVAGDAGIVVDPQRPELIIQWLTRLTTDGDFRRDVVARGRLRAAPFHWSACVQRLHDALLHAS